MFEELSEKLDGVLGRFRQRGVLTEPMIKDGRREIRRVLLEADVNYQLARDFLARVEERALGERVLKAISPGQQIVKLVHDELVALRGGRRVALQLAPSPPTVILLVGLQGSGKTTTAAKLARRLDREGRSPMLAALDIYRPAAIDQLETLGRQIGVPVFADRGERDVAKLAVRALEQARADKRKTVILDSAGRLQIDAELMDELRRVKAATRPTEILLVADGMTGQEAVRIATGFHAALELTGVILTKMDGDARGGAALSIRGATGVPIKFIGVGERLERKLAQTGKLDLNDFLVAMQQLQKLGPLEGLLKMIPGVNHKLLKNVKVDPKRMKHLEAIILSMTPQERARPEILNGSRRARIARGSGRPIQEVNRLLEQFKQVQKLMKQMRG